MSSQQEASGRGEFGECIGMDIRFSPKAKEVLVTRSLDERRSVTTLCRQLFSDFPYGLDLIARNSGQRRFTITKAAVLDPDRVLSCWITESYGSGESPS